MAAQPVLQHWACVVESVETDEFSAVLHDVTDPSRADEVATFRLADVRECDRAFVVPGALFNLRVWDGDYSILFDRSGWTADELRAAAAAAAELEELLGGME